MMDSDFQNAKKYLKSLSRRKAWRRVAMCLACVVVFCTTYALILPAITLEGPGCGLQEHTHSEACYTQVTSLERTVPVCNGETPGLHHHTPDCYAEDGTLRCGYADFVVHSHDSACYAEDGTLWCTLPEISAHTHTDGCYTLPQAEEPHSHGEGCYARERGELICTEHVHEDACYGQTSVLVCALEEQDGHQHGDECRDETGELVCVLEVSEGHRHGDDCFQLQREQLCGVDSDHQHGDACYAWSETLTCELSTEPSETEGEPVLTCGKTEILLHEHTPDCLDAAGDLICGKIQVLAHQHTQLCFETVEEPVDPAVLTCTRTEEDHAHTALCYGAWELTCGIQAHTHTEDCAPAEAAETTQPATEPAESSGLPVMGTAYASGIRTRAFSLMTLSEEEAETEGTTDPLTVNGYITGATLYYRTEDKDWAVVPEEGTIPGNAELKLKVDYGNVPIDTLLAAGGKMTYPLPGLLRNAKTNGSITSGSKEVGTITVTDGTATLTFDEKWLDDQEKSGNTVIDGDFYVEAEADLSQIVDGKPGQIVVGNTTITINFEGDVVARYGNVELTKTVSAISEKSDGDYLTYTLTVTAGQDGCPDVKVVDAFADTKYIAEYVGVTGTATETNGTNGLTETGGTGKVYITGNSDEEAVTKPGTLVWEIGNMGANETRTLTYRVKLVEGYTGARPKDALPNTANVYSKTYLRDTDTASFKPQATGKVSKVAADFIPDENGGGTIQYTVWVHAEEDNTYTLDNVKIVDALDGSLNKNETVTDAEIRKYLSYDEASFQLYEGGGWKQDGSGTLKKIETTNALTLADTNNDGKSNDSFTFNVGSLAPNESKTLVYTVKVEPGVFVGAGNDSVQIKNRAVVRVDGSLDTEGWPMNGYNTTKTLDRKAWSRKLVGQKQPETTINMTGDVYDATGGSISKIDNPGSFTVPAGSYRYQVSANESGDWDLSSASMSDTLGSQHMEFVGYVRVDAYTITEDAPAPASSLADAAAIATFGDYKPTKTVWVKVDGKSTFTFAPKDIGLTTPNQAYLLTYYAQPKALEGITQVMVTNNFRLTGDVGIGDIKYELAGITASASVLVEGTNSFTAQKLSWYYEAPQEENTNFPNGALYWAIKVDGKVLPEGTVIRDTTKEAGGTVHSVIYEKENGSFVGAYIGSLEAITNYADWAALQERAALTPLPSGQYTVTYAEKEVQLKLDADITLGEKQSLYVFVKTAPSELPKTKRESFTYNNKLQSSSDGTNWVDHNVATQTLYGSKNIFKELGRVATYSGGEFTIVTKGTNQAIDPKGLIGEGTYVAWQIHLNYEANLSGRYRVREQIPEGMELAYVRLWWLGDKAKAQTTKPRFAEITDLGAGWTKHENNLSTNSAVKSTNYYYTKDQTVIWDVANLQSGDPATDRDKYAVEIQVVCRVTDPAVLLGGQEKKFNNQVTLFNSDGDEIGSDSDSVSIQKQTLSKTGTYDEAVNGGRYPYQIVLNDLGEDLVSGSDTITLVDELSETLTLDVASIKVVNTKKDEPVVGWIAAVNGQTLTISGLPDDEPLTITYETTVNAAPGQAINISNTAHWQGYSAPDSGQVKVENFQYAAGGTVGVSGTPTVTIEKRDQYDTQKLLPGATFKLEEVIYTEDDGFTPKADGLTLTGTTGDDGTLTFGKDSDNLMAFNTIYRLTETKAPEGYVLDETPHYFAVVKQDDEETPNFPEGVTTYYLSAEYTYQAFNHKGEATVTKKFQGEKGEELDKVNGTYRFGLYDQAAPTGKPLQTVSITYANNAVTPAEAVAKFTNLDLDKPYYVYELNDSDQPIISGSGMVSGKPFLVSYVGNTVKVAADEPVANVTVTNKVNYPELPLTGGRGTTYFYLLGTLLTLAAAMLLATRKRMGRSQ